MTPPAHRRRRMPLAGLAHIVRTLFLVWPDRWRQRRALWEMDDHRLRDIGITRHEAIGQSRLPFWRSGDDRRDLPSATFDGGKRNV